MVAYIDGKYRTLADRDHRGVAGHSMGGYGAVSLAIEYPEVFGAVAALSPWLCDLEVQPTEVEQAFAEFPLVQGLPTVVATRDDLWNIVLTRRETNPVYALAAAWTPNFDKPPFYVDLPMQYADKSIIPDIWKQWLARDLVSQIELDGRNLSKTPVFVDEGRGPVMIYAEMVGIQRLLEALYDQRISYTYDAFDGDHFTHMRYQLTSALTFLYPHITSGN